MKSIVGGMFCLGGLVFTMSAFSHFTWFKVLGAALSISGVLLVLSRGQLDVLLQVRLVPGDIYILLASAAWAYYSWMLAHPTTEPTGIRRDWSAYTVVSAADILQRRIDPASASDRPSAATIGASPAA